MSWKVLITASGFINAGQSAHESLRSVGCELLIPPKLGPLSPPELLPLVHEVDAVIASLDGYGHGFFESEAANRLKLIARWGVGYDSVDLAAATKAGVIVTNTPGVMEDAVAEYTFALLLSLSRQVHGSHVRMRENVWKPAWGSDVAGKTLGIVGFGRIGQSVARRALAFGMRVITTSRNPNLKISQPEITLLTLDRLLAESDFVSLHASLNTENRGLIGKAQIQSMKPGSYLINTARGALVDESALASALCEGRLAGAALDVFATEPLPINSPIRSAPNVLLSPHQASSSRETGERVSKVAAQTILDLMRGITPVDVLNREVLVSSGLRAKLLTGNV